MNRCLYTTALLGLAVVLAAPAAAQGDREAERAARRQQLQLQSLQQQVTQAQAEKARVEQDRAAMEQQLKDRARTAAGAARAGREAAAQLKAAQAEKAVLAQRVVELETQVAEQRRVADETLAAKARELAQTARALQEQGAESSQWQQRFGAQARLVTECSGKNERLLRLSAELLDRWQRKGVVDALRQREPLLGLGDVEMFNLVQDYRDKSDGESFVPRVERN